LAQWFQIRRFLIIFCQNHPDLDIFIIKGQNAKYLDFNLQRMSYHSSKYNYCSNLSPLVVKCGIIGSVGVFYYVLFIATAAMLVNWQGH